MLTTTSAMLLKRHAPEHASNQDRHRWILKDGDSNLGHVRP